MFSLNVLILAGTFEARQLSLNWPPDLKATMSYAGLTQTPPESGLPYRKGGFGGTEGLKRYLKDHGITHLIDATHPFAQQMSAQAKLASSDLNIPLIRFERKAWVKQETDHWIFVKNLEEASLKLDEFDGAVFLTTGAKDVSAFAGKTDRKIYMRGLPGSNLTELGSPFITHRAKPPFHVEEEKAFLLDHQIKVLVSKNSGGSQTEAKIIAARALNIAVIMIERPVYEGVKIYHELDDILNYLKREAQARS